MFLREYWTKKRFLKDKRNKLNMIKSNSLVVKLDECYERYVNNILRLDKKTLKDLDIIDKSIQFFTYNTYDEDKIAFEVNNMINILDRNEC